MPFFPLWGKWHHQQNKTNLTSIFTFLTVPASFSFHRSTISDKIGSKTLSLLYLQINNFFTFLFVTENSDFTSKMHFLKNKRMPFTSLY